MTPLLRILATLSVLELVSVLLLLGNLSTVHASAISHVMGPVHGAFYVSVAAVALLGRGLSPRTRLWALVPVASGPATMINVRAEARR